MRVLTDFHHGSLLRSINLLFGDRLGMDVFRPIGMEWYEQDAWAVFPAEDTARQYLNIASQPMDGTARLNEALAVADGEYKVFDPGNTSSHLACTFDFFKNNKFDYLIASLPQHVPIFDRLIKQYQPEAKLIVQVGNNWNLNDYRGRNVLASIRERETIEVNVKYYHQEFELDVFEHKPITNFRNIFSFTNTLEQSPIARENFHSLENMLRPKGFNMKSYGGQCRDGNMQGHRALADKMRESSFIFHVKETEGFGHVIYNAYAVGRPVIVLKSKFENVLCNELLVPDTFINLDNGTSSAAQQINQLASNPIRMQHISNLVAKRFREVVNYEREAEEIKDWLNTLV